MANTPYDDVFRTLLTDCTELIIPVVNEIFHTNYTGKEKIYLLQNEHFVEMPNGSEQERITDSSFEIQSDLRKHYHIECQSTEDGSIIVRMFEYDTQIALENRELSQDTLTVNFPDSAIVSLRHTKNTPEVMTIRVNTPGGAVSYIVPVLKVKQYTINELFEKKLFFLIPFHIFSYEKSFKELAENREKLMKLEKEYASIKERLEMACKSGDLTEYPKVVILDMSRKVIEHLAVKYENVAKGVCRQMGGKVLNYEAKDILNRGREEGIARMQRAVKLLRMGKSISDVAELTELSEETVAELAQNVEG